MRCLVYSGCDDAEAESTSEAESAIQIEALSTMGDCERWCRLLGASHSHALLRGFRNTSTCMQTNSYNE